VKCPDDSKQRRAIDVSGIEAGQMAPESQLYGWLAGRHPSGHLFGEHRQPRERSHLVLGPLDDGRTGGHEIQGTMHEVDPAGARAVDPGGGFQCEVRFPDAAMDVLALLHLLIGGRVEACAGRSSDGGGEFGERCGDAEPAWGVEPEFVVSGGGSA